MEFLTQIQTVDFRDYYDIKTNLGNRNRTVKFGIGLCTIGVLLSLDNETEPPRTSPELTYTDFPEKKSSSLELYQFSDHGEKKNG